MMNCKKDFPILAQSVHGKPLVFLDSAASSQKPQCVIDALTHYYQKDHANVHRGVYELSARATKAYEHTRTRVKEFIQAEHAHEIIFTRGTTEAINLAAQSYGAVNFKAGDEILVSTMEHHSNIVPWQLIAEKTGAVVREIPITDAGEIDLEIYQTLFSTKTKMVAVVHASNVLGTINPVKAMAQIAHQHGVPILVDGAQAVPHLPVNVRELDCDFYIFSAHKTYGPTGVGVLYGKEKILNAMPPYQGGGEMIATVSITKATYNKLPYKFEAGTPNVADIVAFAAALDYLQQIGMHTIAAHEQDLLQYAEKQLAKIPGLRIIGAPSQKVGVIPFVLDGVHPHDIGTILDHEGVAVRAGHHCAMPLMERFALPACVRVSFGVYNSHEDVDVLVQGLHAVKRLFA